MRSPTTLQWALLFAVLGSLLAVFLPNFFGNLHASRLAEPLDGLRHIATQASMQAAGSPLFEAYPPTVGRTPEQVPAGEAVTDASGTWDHPTWKLLNFRKTEAHYFSFEFESLDTAVGSHFEARAFGDLDGDGELSRFELFGETRPDENPVLYSVRIFREVE